MRYAEAVAAAPPGWERFRPADLGRLSHSTLNLLFTPGPSAPPLEDVAAALAAEPDQLQAVARALPPARGERLLRLGQRPVAAGRAEAAGRRLVRGAFWPLAYELAPELWDRLSAAEVVAPALLSALPADGAAVLEVGAGSGRLTASLAGRASILVALEPSPPLRRLLRDRFPGVHVAAAAGGRLPVRDGWADLAVCCAAPLSSEGERSELERVVRSGGTVAVVEPESRAWWLRHGYEERDFPVPQVRFDPDVEAFFGPPRPPHRMLWKRP